MPVLVDTNVIVDVFYQDPVWENWSKTQMTRYAGDLLINPMVYSELCYRALSAAEVDECLTILGFRYEELPKPALYLAAKAYRAYRQRGGVKTSPLPDFFIGAHAAAAGHTLLTRDRARYETYFPNVPLICP